MESLFETSLSNIIQNASNEKLLNILKIIDKEQYSRSRKFQVLISNSYGGFNFSDFGFDIMYMFDLVDPDCLKTRMHPALLEAFKKFGFQMLSSDSFGDREKIIALDEINVPFGYNIKIDEYDGYERLEYYYNPHLKLTVKELDEKEFEKLDKFFETVSEKYDEYGNRKTF